MARTHYAKNGEIQIAYQVYGDGPLDLVCCFRRRELLRHFRAGNSLES